ncbi:MAG: transposase, partial [Pseudomonadota bacterium]
MPNHVHLILVPAGEDGLRRTLAPLHRQCTGYINARRRQTGHLWQGRFGSVVMDGDHALTAIHYVAMNPVRAGLAQAPEDWPWSSARAYLSGDDDGVTSVETVREMVGDFKSFFGRPFETDQAYGALRQAETIGRPLGSAAWLKDLEARTGR